MTESTINGWEVITGKAASGGWLSKATHTSLPNFELRERAKTRKRCLEAIEFAIELEMENPGWER